MSYRHIFRYIFPIEYKPRKTTVRKDEDFVADLSWLKHLIAGRGRRTVYVFFVGQDNWNNGIITAARIWYFNPHELFRAHTTIRFPVSALGPLVWGLSERKETNWDSFAHIYWRKFSGCYISNHVRIRVVI